MPFFDGNEVLPQLDGDEDTENVADKNVSQTNGDNDTVSIIFMYLILLSFSNMTVN